MSDINREPTQVIIQPHSQARGREGSERQQGKQGKPVPALPGRQAATRHAQETSDQDNIREELKENDVGGEPTNARQFEEQNQKSDQKKIHTVSPCVEPINRPCNEHDSHFSLPARKTNILRLLSRTIS